MAIALQCPHCSNPIRVKVAAAGAEYGEQFKELRRRLELLPTPFTSKQAGAIADELAGAGWRGFRLWAEFREFGFVRRVGPGHRWRLNRAA